MLTHKLKKIKMTIALVIITHYLKQPCVAMNTLILPEYYLNASDPLQQGKNVKDDKEPSTTGNRPFFWQLELFSAV
jgi:hypothetical protein